LTISKQEQSSQLALRVQENEMLTVDLSTLRNHELSTGFGRFEPDEICLVAHAIRARAREQQAVLDNEDLLYLNSPEVHSVQAFLLQFEEITSATLASCGHSTPNSHPAPFTSAKSRPQHRLLIL
jgi:hypothetical protein